MCWFSKVVKSEHWYLNINGYHQSGLLTSEECADFLRLLKKNIDIYTQDLNSYMHNFLSFKSKKGIQ